MPRRQREQGKRQWVDEEDETVDDLAHAATFAMMTMVPNPTPFVSDTVIADDASNKDATFLDTVNQTGRDVCDDDKDDIEIESSIDDEKSICGENKATENHNHNDEDEKDEDDDDDQSDVDLAEELAKMDADENGDDEDENENEEGRNTGGSNIPRPPKTENEVDAYRTPIQELEKHLQFRLTVTLEESDTTLKNRSLISSNLQLAGRIKHYMGFDRTVVVESAVTNPHGDASSFKHDNAPLDEGTLLLIRMPQDMDNKTENDQLLIPLGRIFEVFGPVSQPLYTIRLPTHPKNSDESKLAASKVRKQNVAPLAHSEKKPLLQPDENEECHVQDETTDTKCKDAESPTSEDLRNKTVGNVNKADLHSTDLNEDDSATVHNLADKDNEVQKLLAGNGEASPTKTLITTQDEEDDWSSDGKYAKLLKEKISLPVYYVKNEAKLIDTGFILRNSRKGCGT